MGLFQFIQENQGVGLPADLLRQLTALPVAHISGRRTHQTRNAVFLHIFAHIQTDHGVAAAVNGCRQRLAQLCLTHAGGAHKQQRRQGPPLVGKTRPAPPDGTGHRFHCLVLPHDPLFQGGFQHQER